MTKDAFLLADCRTVLKRAEGALQGVLDVIESGEAQDILRSIAAVVARIDAARAETALQWGLDSIERIARQQGVFGGREGNTVRITGPVVISGPVPEPKPKPPVCGLCEKPMKEVGGPYGIGWGFDCKCYDAAWNSGRIAVPSIKAEPKPPRTPQDIIDSMTGEEQQALFRALNRQAGQRTEPVGELREVMRANEAGDLVPVQNRQAECDSCERVYGNHMAGKRCHQMLVTGEICKGTILTKL